MQFVYYSAFSFSLSLSLSGFSCSSIFINVSCVPFSIFRSVAWLQWLCVCVTSDECPVMAVCCRPDFATSVSATARMCHRVHLPHLCLPSVCRCIGKYLLTSSSLDRRISGKFVIIIAFVMRPPLKELFFFLVPHQASNRLHCSPKHGVHVYVSLGCNNFTRQLFSFDLNSRQLKNKK